MMIYSFLPLFLIRNTRYYTLKHANHSEETADHSAEIDYEFKERLVFELVHHLDWRHLILDNDLRLRVSY